MNRHGFFAVQLTRPIREALAKVQRGIEGEGNRCVPRRHLQITLDDLGEVPEPALEAARLAAERVIARHQPFAVTIKGVEAWPPEAPRMVRALVDDPDGELAALRADLHEALASYGFPVTAGRWRPHVLLARVESAPTRLDPHRDFGPLKVRRLSLYRRERRGFEPGWNAQMPRERPEAPVSSPSNDAIGAELDRRVAERLSTIQRPPIARRRSGRGRGTQQSGEQPS